MVYYPQVIWVSLCPCKCSQRSKLKCKTWQCDFAFFRKLARSDGVPLEQIRIWATSGAGKKPPISVVAGIVFLGHISGAMSVDVCIRRLSLQLDSEFVCSCNVWQSICFPFNHLWVLDNTLSPWPSVNCSTGLAVAICTSWCCRKLCLSIPYPKSVHMRFAIWLLFVSTWQSWQCVP